MFGGGAAQTARPRGTERTGLPTQETSTPKPDETLAAVESAIYMMLTVREQQRPCSLHEIQLEIGNPIRTEDALQRGKGLVHRCGEFAWASRAALAVEGIEV
jgi:hypothetical protein